MPKVPRRTQGLPRVRDPTGVPVRVPIYLTVSKPCRLETLGFQDIETAKLSCEKPPF